MRVLVEGNSIRSTVRIAGAAKNTVTKLLCDAGGVCAAYQDKALVNLSCRRIQVDEIWSFCYAKDRNVPKEHKGEFGYGDVWTWVAIDADTKLVPTWVIGNRGQEAARTMMLELSHRINNRIQLTTDGHGVYRNAVWDVFGFDVDYAQLAKIYGQLGPADKPQRFAPTGVIGYRKMAMQGEPDKKHISTSFVE
ncbi:MAG: DDE-type integrase/transposase/recombinase, partial [Phycisphaerae bacterium]